MGVDGKDTVHFDYQIFPEFPGGNTKILEYINANLKYPINSSKAGIQGRVLVSFLVNEDGTVSDVKVLESVSDEIDEEAVRVVRDMPQWSPALQDGVPITVKYQIPISFRL
jgi:protein TonB